MSVLPCASEASMSLEVTDTTVCNYYSIHTWSVDGSLHYHKWSVECGGITLHTPAHLTLPLLSSAFASSLAPPSTHTHPHHSPLDRTPRPRHNSSPLAPPSTHTHPHHSPLALLALVTTPPLIVRYRLPHRIHQCRHGRGHPDPRAQLRHSPRRLCGRRARPRHRRQRGLAHPKGWR